MLPEIDSESVSESVSESDSDTIFDYGSRKASDMPRMMG